MQAHEKLFDVIYSKNEVTWQSLLYELVKTEEMDPWDINISLLAKKYIDTIKKMKDLDLRISGKMLLASAILLKIKSNRLLNEDLSEFDKLLTESEDELLAEIEDGEYRPSEEINKVPLIPRTPQPRKRKVSVYDLVGALEKALEVKRRRVLNSIPPMNLEVPKKTRDITEVIRDVYGKIKSLFYRNSNSAVKFSQLVTTNTKEDKVFTFVPLLHLTNQRKIDLEQEEHFGDINIMLNTSENTNSQEEAQTKTL